MEHFPRYSPFVRGFHRSRWIPLTKASDTEGALMLSLVYALNKWLGKHSWDWWFETPSRSLWRHCNAVNLERGVCEQNDYQMKTVANIDMDGDYSISVTGTLFKPLQNVYFHVSLVFSALKTFSGWQTMKCFINTVKQNKIFLANCFKIFQVIYRALSHQLADIRMLTSFLCIKRY